MSCCHLHVVCSERCAQDTYPLESVTKHLPYPLAPPHFRMLRALCFISNSLLSLLRVRLSEILPLLHHWLCPLEPLQVPPCFINIKSHRFQVPGIVAPSKMIFLQMVRILCLKIGKLMFQNLLSGFTLDLVPDTSKASSKTLGKANELRSC